MPKDTTTEISEVLLNMVQDQRESAQFIRDYKLLKDTGIRVGVDIIPTLNATDIRDIRDILNTQNKINNMCTE